MTSRVINAEQTKLTMNENIYYSSDAIAGLTIRMQSGDMLTGCRLFDTRCGKPPLYWIGGRALELSSLREHAGFRLTKIGIFPGPPAGIDNSYI
jgi:hypothetical protein